MQPPKSETTLETLGDLAVGALHDLHQSLLIVEGCLELTEQALQAGDLALVTRRLKLAQQAAGQAAARSSEVLSSAGRGPSAPHQPVDAGQVLHEVAQLTSPQWGRVAVRVDAAPGLLILGSPHQIRAALLNLLLRGLAARPGGGEIALSAARTGEEIVVEVADSGVGMSAEPLDTTGLGLAEVYAIVKQHGGSVEVDSRAGRGPCVRLRFPSAPAAPVAPAAPSPPPAALRILLVEDSPTLRDMIALILRRAEHQVDAVGSAEAALAQLEQVEYDLVISELALGRAMHGLDLADAVRRQWPDVVFILATGSAAELSAEEAARAGVEAVLLKPFGVADLRQMVERVAAARRAPHANGAGW